MVCIYCGKQLDVLNSRPQRRNNQVWRRRKCPGCGALFTSHEIIDLSNSIAVLEPGNTFTPFNRDKLLLSIYKSCGHRENALHDASALVDSIIARIIKLADSGSIQKSQIIDSCVQVLRNFDKAAVVQYQAYHNY
ncbi:MAG TPA: ATP cone domain-containing protein [Candidatus Saccharimonadales bacterium]|nr:ATP cone domain-containing protein [Candidatus Saccharimonadales bacterium]